MFIVLGIVALIMPILSLLTTSLYYLQFQQSIRSAILYGFAAAATFYNYVPDIGNDSVRHMYNLIYYMVIPIWKCFDAGYYTQTYVWDFWCWIVAQFELPYLLPATGAFLGYALTAYMVLDYCNLIRAVNRTRIIALVLAFFMSSPVGIAVGIRNSNAFLICILGMYLCEIKNKPRYIGLILMIVGILIHHSALLILLMWIIYPIFKKNPKKTGIIIFSILLLLTEISNFGIKIFSGVSWISEIILDTFKGVTAYQIDNSYNRAVLESLKFKVDSIISICILVMMFTRCKLGIKSKNNIYYETIDKRFYYSTIRLAELFFIVTGALMIVLLINGGRYAVIAQNMAFLSMIFTYQITPFMPYGKNMMIILFLDVAIFVIILISMFLSIYTLTWGNASGVSIVGGMLGGILYSIITTLI